MFYLKTHETRQYFPQSVKLGNSLRNEKYNIMINEEQKMRTFIPTNIIIVALNFVRLAFSDSRNVV